MGGVGDTHSALASLSRGNISVHGSMNQSHGNFRCRREDAVLETVGASQNSSFRASILFLEI
jgi:hypothetical protein